MYLIIVVEHNNTKHNTLIEDIGDIVFGAPLFDDGPLDFLRIDPLQSTHFSLHGVTVFHVFQPRVVDGLVVAHLAGLDVTAFPGLLVHKLNEREYV